MTLILANVGLPMIGVTLPFLAALFIPVWCLEALVLRRVLPLPLGRSLGASGVANVVSTFVGVPVAWLLLLAVQSTVGGSFASASETALERFLTISTQAAWLQTAESDDWWAVPTAGLLLSVPFWLASIVVERGVMAAFSRAASARSVWRAAILANTVSYVLLDIVFVVVLLCGGPATAA